MWELAKKFTGTVLMILSLLLFVLSFIPILFPVIISAGLVIMAVGFLFYRATPTLPKSRKEILDDLDIADLPHSPVSRAGIAAKISLYAMILNVSLYLILILHSWIFYIQPLSRDLEPFRNIFRENPESLITVE